MTTKPADWSIAIHAGRSPLELEPLAGTDGPILRAQDIPDVDARLVADPFMIQHQGRWHLFFEILSDSRVQGVIGLATSEDLLHWTYEGVVLRESFHLSYPCVFAHAGEHYMVPESLKAGAVTLYRAREFPRGWEKVASLVPGAHADPTPFEHAGRWWLFTCPVPYEHRELALYSAPALTGPWLPHPASPVRVDDRRNSRPAGRVIPYEGRLLRFAQDCSEAYGKSVRAFAIERLDLETYVETACAEAPILRGSGGGWNAARMHHVDAHPTADDRWAAYGPWVACVDGRGY